MDIDFEKAKANLRKIADEVSKDLSSHDSNEADCLSADEAPKPHPDTLKVEEC